MSKFSIYTDGSCLGNPGQGGWALVIDAPESEKKELCGGYKLTTNNRMELVAVIRALELTPEKSDVKITTDSRLICDAINKDWLKGWKRKSWKKSDGAPVKNIDLWKILDALMGRRRVRFIWIKGHNEHPLNERCDTLARNAASNLENLLYDNGYLAENA